MSRSVNLEFDGGAEDHSWKASKGSRSTRSYYLQQAQAAFEGADFEKALRLFAKVLEFNPQNVGAWSAQVRMLIELGEYHEARLWADKALERFPTMPELLAAKAVALAPHRRPGCGAWRFPMPRSGAGRYPVCLAGARRRLLARHESRADYCLTKP